MSSELKQALIGRELDAAVAERVMGWTRHSASRLFPTGSGELDYGFLWVPEKFCGDVLYHRSLPRFGADIAAAWEVVGRLRANKLRVHVLSYSDQWEVEIVEPDEGITWREVRTTAPLAICHASLAINE